MNQDQAKALFASKNETNVMTTSAPTTSYKMEDFVVWVCITQNVAINWLLFPWKHHKSYDWFQAEY